MSAIFFDNRKGISLIEILIVVAIIFITLTSLLGVAVFSLKLSTLTKDTTIAVNLAQEAVEATRSIRDSDWNKITNGNHGLTSTGGYWDFAGTENIINGFTRTVLIEDVQPVDPETRKATVIVSWGNKKIEIITYFTNWKQ